MYVKVRVTPGAKREEMKRISETQFAAAVKEPPKQNLANRRVTELLAEALGVAKNKVRLINGHQSPSKMFSVDMEK